MYKLEKFKKSFLSSSSLRLQFNSINGRCISHVKSDSKDATFTEVDIADHSWRQQNHIWTKSELEERKATIGNKFKPKTVSDHIMQGIMKTMYFSFNAVTGYTPVDPTPSSIQWRLIILESFAGVPGFVGAAFRHFYSLRNLQRDHGLIYTLLEEAENERMHLLVCLKMFDASMIVRSLVIAAQFTMTPFLMVTYLVHPPSLNRFVGYLEETAVETYANIIEHTEKDGTKLNTAWKDLDAPDIAIHYWQLPEGERKWNDCLLRMMADEMHHRDVNHTLASLPQGADNPFIHEHMEDFDRAAIRRTETILNHAKEHYKDYLNDHKK